MRAARVDAFRQSMFIRTGTATQVAKAVTKQRAAIVQYSGIEMGDFVQYEYSQESCCTSM